jgi:hypothetical protein
MHHPAALNRIPRIRGRQKQLRRYADDQISDPVQELDNGEGDFEVLELQLQWTANPCPADRGGTSWLS